MLPPSLLPSFDGFLTLLLTFAVRPPSPVLPPSLPPFFSACLLRLRPSFAGMFELEMLECRMPFAVLVRCSPSRRNEATMGCDPFAQNNVDENSRWGCPTSEILQCPLPCNALEEPNFALSN